MILFYFYIYSNEGFYKIYLFYMLEYVEIYINRRRAVFFIKMVECAENI